MQRPHDELPTTPAPCQLTTLPGLSEGVVPLHGISSRARVRLAVRRHLSVPARRALKRRLVRVLDASSTGGATPAERPPTKFQAGEQVRVRSRPEIEDTLDLFHQLKGCAFMNEMAPYCGTVQRVLKPVQRFVDERDYQVKSVRGMYLLEGLMCEGTPPFGSCDRGCLYFWREEWLEPFPPAPEADTGVTGR
jgi:hypothetical protein